MEYSYKITKLIYDENGIVITVFLEGTASDGTNTIVAPLIFNCKPASENVVPLDNLNEGTILTWVDCYPLLQGELDRLFKLEHYPSLAIGSLPWE